METILVYIGGVTVAVSFWILFFGGRFKLELYDPLRFLKKEKVRIKTVGYKKGKAPETRCQAFVNIRVVEAKIEMSEEQNLAEVLGTLIHHHLKTGQYAHVKYNEVAMVVPEKDNQYTVVVNQYW